MEKGKGNRGSTLEETVNEENEKIATICFFNVF
jgi:hypothetical protein